MERNTDMHSFEDQIGSTIRLAHPPRRIVSFVPSQTELLFDLGLADNIVGITEFCIHPRKKCAPKTKVDGPKSVNFEIVEQLAPDLVIANREENDRDQVMRLAEKYPT